MVSERSVGFLRLRGLEHQAEDADQILLDFPVLVVERLQLLLGRSLGSAVRGC